MNIPMIPESQLPVKSPSGQANIRYEEGGKSFRSPMPDVVAATESLAAVIDDLKAEAEQALDEANSEIQASLVGIGYKPPIPFASGINVDNPLITVSYNGEVYAPVYDEVPFVTTATFDQSQWKVVQGVAAIDLSSTGAGQGAELVGFIQEGTGMVARTSRAKARDIISAEDRGISGSGADETAAIQDLLNASIGKTLILGRGKTYGYNPVVGINIPSNVNIVCNGSKFKRISAQVGTVTDSSYNFVINSNCTIDRIEIDCIGGFNDISGLLISGSDVEIGSIKLNTPSRSAAQGNAWVGAKIGPDTGSSSNVRIGNIEADLFDRAFMIQNVNGGSLGFIKVSRYRRGLYLKDVKNFNVNGGYISISSVGNTGKAGENGILLESVSADYGTENVRIENVTVENAGEHGFRIGGQKIMRSIWHVNCISRGHGAGYGTEGGVNDDDHGGCGFKALGPTSVNGARHQNIYYDSCVAEAGVLDNLDDRPNFAGFHIAKCYNVHLISPSVRPTISPNSYAAPLVYSCLRGIEILGCEQCSVSDPVIVGHKRAGIMIYDASNTGGVDWGPTTNVKITGGQVITANATLPAEACVEVNLNFITARRITIDNLLCEGANYAVKCSVSGSGAVNAPSCNITSWSQVTEVLNGCSAWIAQVKGQSVGSNLCRNGSSFNDWTNGALKVMKAGAWVNL